MAKLSIAVVVPFLLKIMSVLSDQSYLCRISQIEPSSYEGTIRGQLRTFPTPNYPERTPSGYCCWWRAESSDQPLQLNCSYALPSYSQCDRNTPDRIEVTTDGFVDYYCGSGCLLVDGASRLVFITSKFSHSGKMFCEVSGPTIPEN